MEVRTTRDYLCHNDEYVGWRDQPKLMYLQHALVLIDIRRSPRFLIFTRSMREVTTRDREGG